MAQPMYALPPAADTVGGRIAQARSYSRLSQSKLIASVGVDRKTLSSWENDHTSPTVDQLILIARAVGFPTSWFVDGVDPNRGPVVTARYQPLRLAS